MKQASRRIFQKNAAESGASQFSTLPVNKRNWSMPINSQHLIVQTDWHFNTALFSSETVGYWTVGSSDYLFQLLFPYTFLLSSPSKLFQSIKSSHSLWFSFFCKQLTTLSGSLLCGNYYSASKAYSSRSPPFCQTSYMDRAPMPAPNIIVLM